MPKKYDNSLYSLYIIAITYRYILVALSTEQELISYTTKSYEEACMGVQPLNLTAQRIVNTARVFYKKELNPLVRLRCSLSLIFLRVT